MMPIARGLSLRTALVVMLLAPLAPLSVAAAAGASCTLDGVTVAHRSTRTSYSQRTVSGGGAW